MRALEDALAIAQAGESASPHPLLTAGFVFDDENMRDSEQRPSNDKVESIAEAFGTLHIDEKERTQRFFGPSGGSEVCLLAGDRECMTDASCAEPFNCP